MTYESVIGSNDQKETI